MYYTGIVGSNAVYILSLSQSLLLLRCPSCYFIAIHHCRLAEQSFQGAMAALVDTRDTTEGGGAGGGDNNPDADMPGFGAHLTCLRSSLYLLAVVARHRPLQLSRWLPAVIAILKGCLATLQVSQRIVEGGGVRNSRASAWVAW
jgi:hypothetical protein